MARQLNLSIFEDESGININRNHPDVNPMPNGILLVMYKFGNYVKVYHKSPDGHKLFVIIPPNGDTTIQYIYKVQSTNADYIYNSESMDDYMTKVRDTMMQIREGVITDIDTIESFFNNVMANMRKLDIYLVDKTMEMHNGIDNISFGELSSVKSAN